MMSIAGNSHHHERLDLLPDNTQVTWRGCSLMTTPQPAELAKRYAEAEPMRGPLAIPGEVLQSAGIDAGQIQVLDPRIPNWRVTIADQPAVLKRDWHLDESACDATLYHSSKPGVAWCLSDLVTTPFFSFVGAGNHIADNGAY